MEGYRDPLNRRPYPWGKEDTELLAHYRMLSAIRREHRVFACGDTEILYAENGVFDFVRSCGSETLRICVNRSDHAYAVDGAYTDVLFGDLGSDGVSVAPDAAVILKIK